MGIEYARGLNRMGIDWLLYCSIMAELVNASIVHPRYLCANLDKDRKDFPFLFVSHLNSNL
jgi:hypothetical protein